MRYIVECTRLSDGIRSIATKTSYDCACAYVTAGKATHPHCDWRIKIVEIIQDRHGRASVIHSVH